MTNGEKIQTILDVDRDCTGVHGENGTMTFTVTQDFWNAEYKEPRKALEQEPTTKNDLAHNLCSSCTNIGCEFQSGIVRTECAFYMPPHVEPDNCGNYVVQKLTAKNDLGVDAISRQSVLDKIQRLIDAEQNNIDEHGDYMNYARERVNAYEAIQFFVENDCLCPSVTPQEPRWIPVSEGLPENKETVLVTFKHFVSGNTIGLGSVILLRGKPHWHVREQNLGTYDVLAWMPLPKAYREVEE